jgi:hypothetical protein
MKIFKMANNNKKKRENEMMKKKKKIPGSSECWSSPAAPKPTRRLSASNTV